jgi:hypothetical protein
MAVEVKRGVSQLELLYEQITKEELAKQQKKEHKKQKRRKKKEKRAEQEEKENNCEVCFILLNSNVAETSEDIGTIDNSLEIELQEPQPTIMEVKLAIAKLKNNKAPGTDLIQAELIKHVGAEYIKHLHQFITKIWITETIPEEWNMSMLCPIHER